MQLITFAINHIHKPCLKVIADDHKKVNKKANKKVEVLDMTVSLS